MTNASIQYIAKQIKTIRKQSSMTQAEVAKKAGISTNFYARLERGDTSTSLTIFENVVKALGAKSKDILPF